MNGATGKSLAHNTGWAFLGQALGIGLRGVYFVIIARLLGVVQYGIVVGAFALVNLVAEHSRVGTGTVLLRYVAPDHKRFHAYWGSVLIVTSLAGTAIVVALRLLAPHVLDPASASIVGITAAGSCLCEQLTISSTQAFQAFQEMRTAALLNQLTSLLRTAAAVAMIVALHRCTAWQWATASMCASAVATVIAFTVVTARLGWPAFAPLLALKHSGEGAEYSLSASATSAYNDLDKTMLSHYGMSSANGIYGMAYRIIEMGTVPAAAIQLAATPRLFELAGIDLKGPILLGRRLLRHSVLASLCSAASMFLLAPLIPFMVGKSFAGGVIALQWICFIPVFRSVHGVTGSVLTSIGRQRYRTCTQIAAVGLNFLLNLWLIPAHGWHGAAWSSLATDGALALLNWAGLKWLGRSAFQPASAIAAGDAGRPAIPGEFIPHKPLVSIIIPYFNHPAYLGDAVTSAMQQSHPNLEIVVIDDGSAVPASSILDVDALTRAHPNRRMTVLRTPNGGAAAARNLGFRHSSGDYLIFLDSDDRLLPSAIESHLKVLDANPDAGMTFGPARIIDEHGRQTRPARICRPRTNYFLMLLESNPIACPGSTMMRRQAFIDAGLFNESFRNAEDYHLYLRIARRRPIARHKVTVAEYRKHGGGKSQNKQKMIAAVMRILDEFDNSGVLTPAERRRLRHGRRRWLHEFLPEPTLLYQLRELYFRFRAMLTVRVRHYISSRHSENPSPKGAKRCA